jgi:hypothetical protein
MMTCAEQPEELMTFTLSSEQMRPYTLESAESSAPLCMDKETKEKVRELMLDAIDMALKDHIMHTFEIWMRDESGQPARARKGVQNGVSAYIRSRAAVLAWNPSECR